MRSLDEQETPRLNTLEGNPVQLGKEDGGQNAEFMRFLRYAKRSCMEVQSERVFNREPPFGRELRAERLNREPNNLCSYKRSIFFIKRIT